LVKTTTWQVGCSEAVIPTILDIDPFHGSKLIHSERVAWQYIQDLANRLGKRLD
jgi:hypothetical protein